MILSIYLLLLNFNIQYYIVCGWFWFDEKNGYAGLKFSLTRKLKKTREMSAANFPCSICEATFHSPKDLGTHILQQHCEEATPKKVNAI